MDEIQLKVIKKYGLENRDESNDYTIFGHIKSFCFC